MSEGDLLTSLLQLEQEIQFTTFTNDMALEIGLALLQEARNRGKSITADITRHGHQLFHVAMEGTTPDNDQWIRRKNNVVNRFGHSSFYIGRRLNNLSQTIEEKYFVSSTEYTAHGGGFPIILAHTGVIGTVTVSGMSQQEDHELVVTVLRKFLSK